MVHNASRLFIDLVYSGTSRWANWEPPLKIEVGDYGIVDKETGQFIRHGSVYDDLDDISLHLEKYAPELKPIEKDFLFKTHNARRIDVGGGPEAQITGIVEASFAGQYVFGRESGALLAMSRPRMKALPYNFPYEKLTEIKQLDHKAIVVNTFICPSFALYLSQGKEDVISLEAEVVAPIPAALGLEAGGKGHVSWKFERASGFPRAASSENYDFTPLYSLRINKPRGHFHLGMRGSPKPAEDDEPRPQIYDPSRLLADYPIPWDTLDEEGDEADT
jgi:hypothetical protein